MENAMNSIDDDLWTVIATHDIDDNSHKEKERK